MFNFILLFSCLEISDVQNTRCVLHATAIGSWKDVDDFFPSTNIDSKRANVDANISVRTDYPVRLTDWANSWLQYDPSWRDFPTVNIEGRYYRLRSPHHENQAAS